MPKINIVKSFRPKSFYHIYNRGINKQDAFFESEDFEYFLECSRKSLLKFGSVKVFAHAVLTNHFHFVVYQKEERTITRWMRSLTTKYVMYVNKKYGRSGPLFDHTYRAVLITSKKQFDAVVEYVLANPEEAGLKNWPYFGKGL